MQSCRISGFQIGKIAKGNRPVILAELLPGEERFEDGVLPPGMIDPVYFNDTESYVVLNPALLK